jgi:hypothetical protein
MLPRYGFIVSMPLACLLLLAQWTGFWMVLCVGGPDHVQFESLAAPCCGPETPRAGMSEDAGEACAGCTDLSIETASASDPSRRPDTGATLAVIETEGPVRAAAGEGISEGGRPPLALVPSIATVPLRC